LIRSFILGSYLHYCFKAMPALIGVDKAMYYVMKNVLVYWNLEFKIDCLGY